MTDDDHSPQPPQPSAAAAGGKFNERNGEAVPQAQGRLSRLRQKFHAFLTRKPTLQQAVETLMEEAPPVDAAQVAGVPFTPGLLANVLSLREKTVADCLTPRADIIAIEVSTPMKELVTRFAEEGHTRLPVYHGKLDQIVGMVHLKDVFACLAESRNCRLRDLVREVLFVPAAMPVGRLLLLMKQKRQHLAMVVDEFGGVDGLVTFEDLMEEIVGEVEDEHDEAGPPLITKRGDGVWAADARIGLDMLRDQTGLDLSSDTENVDTLGGLVFALAGRIPARGEVVRHPSGALFEIIDTDPKRIRRLIVRRQPPREPAAPLPKAAARS